MPFPNFDPLDEGEALTAASLNSKLQDTRGSINALPADAISSGALRSEHLSAITLNNLSTDASGAAVNMTHTNPTPTAISGNYDNIYTGTPVTVPNSRGTFLGWGDGLGGTGWAGIAVNGGGLNTRAQLVFPLPGLTIMPTTGAATSSQLCTGLLVKVNVGVLVTPASGGQPKGALYSAGMGLSIFWQGNSSTYHWMPSSLAFKSRANAVFADIATTALITKADLDAPFGGAAAETAVFSVGAAICCKQLTQNLYIREWRISAIPIYGGSL
tara:strand:+ start:2880 stop:3692 length:813 start_codon:yes stop_codon:yes gene_type:complete